MGSNDKLAATFHPATTHQCARCNRTILVANDGITTCTCGVRHHAAPTKGTRS